MRIYLNWEQRKMRGSSGLLSKTGSSEAVVLVKAVPQASGAHGETVCVAALDAFGQWHRLYPVCFQELTAEQRFGRWDRISFDWRLPEVSKDRRVESKRIVQESVKRAGLLKPAERQRFLEKAIIDSPDNEYQSGRSLALVRPIEPTFRARKRSDAEIALITAGYAEIQASPDLFGTTEIVPREASPYEFSYRYRDADRLHENSRCHDWETEQTFLNWRRKYGEEKALKFMHQTFGEKYPAEGMVLAMGTHGQRNWQWLIIGVIKLGEIVQTSLNF